MNGMLWLPLLFRFIRFGYVGIVCGVWYAVVVFVAIHWLQLEAATASLVAYALAIPVSFIGHRNYTFRMQGRVGSEVVKFAVVQAANLYIAYELMRWVTQDLGYSYWMGVSACILAIPIGTFVIMNALVFVVDTKEDV